MELRVVIPIIFLAVSFACLYSYYMTGIIGGFIRVLEKRSAVDEGSAISVEEASDNRAVRFILRLTLSKGTSLRRFVCSTMVGENTKYYLNPESRDTVLSRFDNKGMSFITVVICIAIMAVFTVIVSLFAPFMENVIGNYASPYVPDDVAMDEITDSFDGENDNTAVENGAENGNSGGGRYDTAE